MKPYGVPRIKHTQTPDKGDIRFYGLAVQGCKLRSKATTRRIWKRYARIDNKLRIKEGLYESL